MNIIYGLLPIVKRKYGLFKQKQSYIKKQKSARFEGAPIYYVIDYWATDIMITVM
jgi:hypothetical protein